MPPSRDEGLLAWRASKERRRHGKRRPKLIGRLMGVRGGCRAARAAAVWQHRRCIDTGVCAASLRPGGRRQQQRRADGDLEDTRSWPCDPRSPANGRFRQRAGQIRPRLDLASDRHRHKGQVERASIESRHVHRHKPFTALWEIASGQKSGRTAVRPATSSSAGEETQVKALGPKFNFLSVVWTCSTTSPSCASVGIGTIDLGLGSRLGTSGSRRRPSPRPKGASLTRSRISFRL